MIGPNWIELEENKWHEDGAWGITYWREGNSLVIYEEIDKVGYWRPSFVISLEVYDNYQFFNGWRQVWSTIFVS